MYTPPPGTEPPIISPIELHCRRAISSGPLWPCILAIALVVNPTTIAALVWAVPLQYGQGIYSWTLVMLSLAGGLLCVLVFSVWLVLSTRRKEPAALAFLTLCTMFLWNQGTVTNLCLKSYALPAPQSAYDDAVGLVQSRLLHPDENGVVALPLKLHKLSRDGQAWVNGIGDRMTMDFKVSGDGLVHFHYIYCATPLPENYEHMPNITCGSWKRSSYWYLVAMCDWDD